jgi:hypothetical protein
MGLLLAFVVLAALAATPFSQTSGVSVTLSPTSVETGTRATVTLTTAGFPDLSVVGFSQIEISPPTDISDLRIEGQTAQRLHLSFQISAEASAGTRTLRIKNRDGSTQVALDLGVRVGGHICRPECEFPATCKNNVCVTPGHICRPACKYPATCRNSVCVPPPPQPIHPCTFATCPFECPNDLECVCGQCKKPKMLPR